LEENERPRWAPKDDSHGDDKDGEPLDEEVPFDNFFDGELSRTITWMGSRSTTAVSTGSPWLCVMRTGCHPICCNRNNHSLMAYS